MNMTPRGALGLFLFGGALFVEGLKGNQKENHHFIRPCNYQDGAGLLVQSRHALEDSHAHVFQLHHQHSCVGFLIRHGS